MRVVVILLLIAAVLFGWQAYYYRGQSDDALAQATAIMAKDPDAAFLKIKPLFEYSGVTTFGKSGDSIREFYKRMADGIISRLQTAENIEPDFFDSMYHALKVLNAAGKEHQMDMTGRISSILAENRRQLPRLASILPLRSWDSMAAQVGQIQREGLAPDAAKIDLDSLIADLGKTDRRAIGMRDASHVAALRFQAAIRALGREPSAADGPLLAPLPKGILDETLIDAEKLLREGEDMCDRMRLVFKDPQIPAEVRAAWAKLLYDQCAMRVQHLIDIGRQGQSQASGYLISIFIHPGSGPLPNDAEIYGAFAETVQQQIQLVIKVFEDPKIFPPGEANALQATAYRLQGQYLQATFRAGGADPMAAFRAAAARPGLTPVESQAMAQMSQGDSVFLLLR